MLHTLAILAALVTSIALYTGCNNDLRPSAFTSGWSEPTPTASMASVAQEGLFPGTHIGSMDVFKDWRDGHDPKQPCPWEMTLVANEYCVDRWEGSLVEMTAAGEVPFPSNQRVGDRLVRAQSRPGVRPQAYLSGAEAQRACQMAGKRLCSRWEWWRACAGSKKTIYPYGTMHIKDRCNEERPMHPVVEFYGPDAGAEIWFVESMNNPQINTQPGTLSMTGERQACRSEDGIFDMVGNVHEWTNDPAGSFHGGAYSGKIALGCQYVTTAHDFSYHDYSTGFRCCTDPYEEE